MNLEVRGVDELAEELKMEPYRITKAMARAMTRAVDTGATLMSRLIAGDTGLPVREVRAGLAVAHAAQLEREVSAALGSKLARLPLTVFGPRQTRRGVSYKFGGGRKVVESAFMAKMKSGHEGVFKRVGKQRLPITELAGPSLGHVFAKFRPQVSDTVVRTFQERFAHEMNRLSSVSKPGP